MLPGHPGLRSTRPSGRRVAASACRHENLHRSSVPTHRQSSESDLKILNLVKIARPMQRPVCCATVAPKRDRVAQPLSKLGEIPNSTILPPVVMAARATDVLL